MNSRQARHVFLLVVSAILFSCSSGGSGGGVPQGMLEIAYANLSEYSLTIPYNASDEKIFTATGQPIVTLALGLTAPVSSTAGLDMSFDLYVGEDTTPYKLYPSGELDTDVYTAGAINAEETSYLTIPLHLGKAAYDKLIPLTESTPCRIVITLDPQNRQPALAALNKTQEINVVYLPQNLFDLPTAGATMPPYSNKYFSNGYNEEWGISGIAQLRVKLWSTASWEPMASYPKIPYAVGLNNDADIHANIFSNNVQIVDGSVMVNANTQYLTYSGYKAYLELFGISMFKSEYFLKANQLQYEWTPAYQTNLPENLLPREYKVMVGNVQVTIRAEIKGTFAITLPGNIDLSGSPWKLNQAFSPQLKSQLVCSVTASDTRLGITAPVTLSDVQLRLKLSDVKVNPSVPNVDARMEWPGDYTLLKGSIYITRDGKPIFKVYEYSIIDKNIITRQEGYIHAVGNTLDVYPGKYREQTPRK